MPLGFAKSILTTAAASASASTIDFGTVNGGSSPTLDTSNKKIGAGSFNFNGSNQGLELDYDGSGWQAPIPGPVNSGSNQPVVQTTHIWQDTGQVPQQTGVGLSVGEVAVNISSITPTAVARPKAHRQEAYPKINLHT